jgi:hypothetical protein
MCFKRSFNFSPGGAKKGSPGTKTDGEPSLKPKGNHSPDSSTDPTSEAIVAHLRFRENFDFFFEILTQTKVCLEWLKKDLLSRGREKAPKPV